MKNIDSNTQYVYWCSTPSHIEDWFIQAKSIKQAKEAFAELNGFDETEVRAKLVCEIPKKYNKKNAYCLQVDKLKCFGFDILQTHPPRIVRLNGRIYKEKTLFEYIIDDDFFKEPLVYLINVRGTDNYKIGSSKAVYNRKKGLFGNSPYHLDLINVIKTPSAKSLEGKIRAKFKKFKSAGEWLQLDDWGAEIVKIIFDMYRREYMDSSVSYIASTTCEVLVDSMLELLESHTYKATVPQSDITKLRILHNLVRKIPLSAESNEPREILKRIYNLQKQLEELKSKLISNFTIKAGDSICDEHRSKYEVKEVLMTFSKDESMSECKVSYCFRTNKVLGNGKLAKRTTYLLPSTTPGIFSVINIRKYL